MQREGRHVQHNVASTPDFVKRGTTIKRVAVLAGVSTATVSRTLSGFSCVSPETRERVLRVCSENNYTPNEHARELARRALPRMTRSVVPEQLS